MLFYTKTPNPEATLRDIAKRIDQIEDQKFTFAQPLTSN
jgi:hypothetical protein